MIEDGKEVKAEITSAVWADAIFAWDLLNANSLALSLKASKISGEVEDGAHVRGRVEVGEGTILRSGCYVIGPVSIGRNCDIGPNVTVLPASSIGDSVRIGSNSEIRNSIVMNGARIGSSTIITDSVVGASSSLADQVVTDSGPAIVDIEGEVHRAEFGAIIADNAVIGSRVLMQPGTVVGTDARIGSGAVVRGWLDRGSKVI